jgi:hypothetical protein
VAEQPEEGGSRQKRQEIIGGDVRKKKKYSREQERNGALQTHRHQRAIPG